MTDPVERALAKARLRPIPYTAADIGRAEERLRARITSRMWSHALDVDDEMEPARTAAARSTARDSLPLRAFHQQLKRLCEAVVTRDLHKLQTFLAHRVLEPEGALVLGCVLSLASREDSARFWWQFAAGAGDEWAACCLCLHHMAHGEVLEARWWYQQLDPDQEEFDFGVLLLDCCNADRTDPGSDTSIIKSAVIRSVMAYVPRAVDYVDDVELPLPAPDFAHRIEELTEAP